MRHLMHHIYPVAEPRGRACWQWHLRQLNRCADVFDGQRLFAIVQGPDLLPSSEVVPLLPPRSVVLVLPNHPELGEAYALPMLLSRSYTVSLDDAVFYSHSKGVTHVRTFREPTTRWWSLAMYRWLFSPEVIEAAPRTPAIGWLKYDGPAPVFPPTATWHFPGTFFWFRAAEIFGRNWWSVVPSKYGSECYLSGFFPSNGVASLYTIAASEYWLFNCEAAPYAPQFWEKIAPPTGPDADSWENGPL